MDATSGAAAAWWWLGLVVLFFVVAPLVVILAQRLAKVIVEIKRYSEDVLAHGLGITTNLAPVPALIETRDLVKSAGPKLAGYVGSVDRILG
ncbi:MAG: hypothetical protein M3391_09105 [Actinomycetota bacterium]|nr:hypothetical protein [Actinomycetota bacterium]